MRSHLLARPRAHCYRSLLVLALAVSAALGSIGAGAQTPSPPAATVAATATPDNSAGSLNAPPPTPPPTATTAPTPMPAATPTTVAATPATPAASASGTPAAAPPSAGTPAPAAAPVTGNGTVDSDDGGGGPSNTVKVINKNDGKFRLKGKVQVNRIPGDSAQPVNDAEAYSSCANCETFAVALQVDLISRTATTIAPQNVAVAVNVQCSHCYTAARAVQYVIQVDDPTQVPDDVNNLVNQMQQQLKAAAQDKDATAAQTEARVDAVIAQFTQFAQNLNNQRGQEDQDDTPGGTVPPDATP